MTAVLPSGYSLKSGRVVKTRGHKYRAVRTEVDGRKFSSKLEARRYSQLKLLEDAGHIFDLKLQPRFPLVVSGVTCGTYVADFSYRDRMVWKGTGEPVGRLLVVEDAKGKVLDLFTLKANLFSVLYPNIRFLVNGKPYIRSGK